MTFSKYLIEMLQIDIMVEMINPVCCSFNIRNRFFSVTQNGHKGHKVVSHNTTPYLLISSIYNSVKTNLDSANINEIQSLAQFNVYIEISYSKNMLKFVQENVFVPFRK